MRIRALLSFLFSVMLLVFASCGGHTSLIGSGTTGATTVPQFNHVAIVVIENASYGDVIGQPSMPYLNSLASKNSLLQSYHATAHPSIPNYFMLTTGQTVTSDDSFSGSVSMDNLAREFIASKITWKAYEESIPSVGYIGGDSGLYIERHDPFSYFTDVRNSAAQTENLVPYSQLATDLGSGSLPNFLWIGPNAVDNAHSCPAANPNCTHADELAAADSWLSTNIPPLLNNPTFSASGLLILVFDEGDVGDLANGGGHVVCMFAGTHVKTNYTSTATYSHQDVEGLIAKALRLQTTPGAGSTGASMTEFFQ